MESKANTLVEKGSAMITTSNSQKKEHENPRLGSVGRRFGSILAATDCSPASEIAIKMAARLAKESHARLYVLHSLLPDFYAVDTQAPDPELALMDLQNARENLHKYVEHIPDLRAVKHQEIVFLGSPGDAIQSAGESNGIACTRFSWPPWTAEADYWLRRRMGHPPS